MPTKNPRIHVVLEPPLYTRLKGRAEKNGLSISLEARELIRDALRAPGGVVRRPYTGKQIGALVGRCRLGKDFDPESELVSQAHG